MYEGELELDKLIPYGLQASDGIEYVTRSLFEESDTRQAENAQQARVHASAQQARMRLKRRKEKRVVLAHWQGQCHRWVPGRGTKCAHRAI